MRIPPSHPLFVVAALVALPTLAGAQRKSTASIGVGAGSASFSCDVCSSQRNNSLSEMLRLGTIVKPGLVLSGEASRWRGDYGDSRGSGTATASFVSFTAQWSPWADDNFTEGFFLKAGAGLAHTHEQFEGVSASPTVVTTTGPSFVLGAGWNVWVAEHFAVTPYADYNVAAKATQSVNDLPGTQLGANILHLGVALTVR